MWLLSYNSLGRGIPLDYFMGLSARIADLRKMGIENPRARRSRGARALLYSIINVQYYSISI